MLKVRGCGKHIRCECSKELSTCVVGKPLMRTEDGGVWIQSLVELSGSRGRYPVRDVVVDPVGALHAQGSVYDGS